LAAVHLTESATRADNPEDTAGKIAECDPKLTQYRAALDAGANPATVAAWIAETEAEKAGYQLAARRIGASRPRRMSEARSRPSLTGSPTSRASCETPTRTTSPRSSAS
jgi:hypothetical protein